MKKKLKFFKEKNEDIIVFIPTIAFAKENGLKSVQFYFLYFRLAIIWGDI